MEEIDEKLTIYPNPANDQIAIEADESLHVQVIDVFGNQIQELNLNPGNNSVDISGLATGVYFVVNPNGTTSKFIKK